MIAIIYNSWTEIVCAQKLYQPVVDVLWPPLHTRVIQLWLSLSHRNWYIARTVLVVTRCTGRTALCFRDIQCIGHTVVCLWTSLLEILRPVLWAPSWWPPLNVVAKNPRYTARTVLLVRRGHLRTDPCCYMWMVFKVWYWKYSNVIHSQINAWTRSIYAFIKKSNFFILIIVSRIK